ncbi:hypothetical protein NLI96_g5119 [Meripilus lineatus]|uniref:Uncharacterized protein n=1 Tax=Meripilus lineatus TaxID=2056292 RepID=A0AAD5YH83_9APHY|nr:hypothetical protein NLI96_g5119 [Physisporinus lineatus]
MSHNQRAGNYYTGGSSSRGHSLHNPPTYWAPALAPAPVPITPDNRRDNKKPAMPMRLHPNGKRRIAIHEVAFVHGHPQPIPLQDYQSAGGDWSLTGDSLVTPEDVFRAQKESRKHK